VAREAVLDRILPEESVVDRQVCAPGNAEDVAHALGAQSGSPRSELRHRHQVSRGRERRGGGRLLDHGHGGVDLRHAAGSDRRRRPCPAEEALLPHFDVLAPLRYPHRVTEYRFTEYFEKEVLRKRPYLKKEWCVQAVERPLRAEPQENNR
jgi:hypothetical protein